MKIIAALFLLLLTQQALAQTPTPRQDIALIREAVEQFLQTQSAGLPGQTNIVVGTVDSRLNIPPCAAPEAFMPAGSRAYGKTTVGVRCTAPAPWTIYVSAAVQVMGEYIAVAAPLAQGQIIGVGDIAKVKGDLSALPAGIITDPSQAIGRTASSSLASGTPLRQDSLRSQQAMQQGQAVRLVSTGPGFRVSTEAKALTSANEGQIIQAKTATGQVISGIAKSGGVVEVSY